MGEYTRPYTEQQVDQIEQAADEVGRLLHKPWAAGREAWRSLDAETLADLFYDAMIALREAMMAEEDD